MVDINAADYLIVENNESRLYLAKHRSLFYLPRKDQMIELAQTNGFMPTIRDFADLVLLIDSKKPVYNGNKKKISTIERKEILDEILEVRNSWGAENLDNRFFVDNGKMYMASGHRVIDKQIIPSLVKEVDPLMQHGSISLRDLDEDGLAIKVGGRSLYYWHPRDDSVARFCASSDGIDLDCGGYPQSSNLALGVREARESLEV